MVLSIIVPIYGVEKYLQKCLESLIVEDFFDKYEIILVDDGSLDNSKLIVDKYASQYSNIHAYHKKNGGLSDARNFGLDRAYGDFIMFVDGDDYIEKEKLLSVISILEDCSDDILCFGAYHVSDSGKKEIKDTAIKGKLSGIEYFKLQCIKKTFRIAVWNYIFRRKLLLDNKLYFKKGILHEDNEWLPRVFFIASQVSNYDLTYYNYNIRQDSICTKKDKTKNIEDMGNTLLSLSRQYKNMQDKTAYRLLKDYLTGSYLHLFTMTAKSKDNVTTNKLSFDFLIRDLYFFKTKIKVIILSYFPFIINKFKRKALL